jgi:hypothetical protein
MGQIDLDRIEPEYLAAARGKWKTLKDKHAAALKAKKITFKEDLGPLLDKRPPLYKTVRSWKAGGSLSPVKAAMKSIASNAKEIETVVKSYKVKIVGLGDPAEKELRKALDDMLSDVVKVDTDYVKAK